VGFIPLNDLGAGTYQGKPGGLYPGGQNVPPVAYLNAGKAKAAAVQPINGKIVVLSQAFSNPYQEFPQFQAQAASDPAVNPAVVTINGASGGGDAWAWQNPTNEVWARADEELAAQGLSRADVQVIWFKTVRIGSPAEVLFPTDATQLQQYTRTWVANMEAAYPNLKLSYISTKTYAGNAQVGYSTEPRAYQGGFAAKWLIEERINGTVTGPAHLAWGPYLWADGTKPRSDGLTWPCNEFDKDGVHPGPAMEAKVGTILLNFFKTVPTTKTWFLTNGQPGPTATPAPPVRATLTPTASPTATPAPR
jgi:hypothetical protein